MIAAETMVVLRYGHGAIGLTGWGYVMVAVITWTIALARFGGSK